MIVFLVRVVLFKLMPIGCCEKPFCETNSRDLHEYLEGGKLRARRVKISKRMSFRQTIIIHHGPFNSKHVNQIMVANH